MIKASRSARHGTSLQIEAPIVSQYRNRHEISALHSIEVNDALRFSDAALSGADKHLGKHKGFEKLRYLSRALTEQEMRTKNAIVKLAFYARFSCDRQRETSIEDQFRRCHEVAARHGIAADDVRYFSDSALSGTDRHRDKREGFEELIKAWDAGEISVIIVDDVARLCRDAVEHATIQRRLEKNQRVRLITDTGIDTHQKNWQLQFSLQGMMSQQQVRDTQHLVVRGMEGQLERGFMVATPPFGYSLDRRFDEMGNRIGTYWQICESEAAFVIESYLRRDAGQSMHQIGRWLNEEGVQLQRKARNPDGGYWRASRVRTMLSNPIYRGMFIWNASVKIRAEAEKTGRELTEKQFPRPDLRLVSDEQWYRCNQKSISRSGYGGGKHAFAGLFRCGCCGSVLVLSSGRCRSLYCANCTIAKSMLGMTETVRMTSTVAAKGVQVLLVEAMRDFISPKFVNYFRNRLSNLLTGDQRQEIEQYQVEVAKLRGIQLRLSKMLTNSQNDDKVLEDRYKETRERLRQAELILNEAISGATIVDEATISAQLNADPADILDGLFDEDVPPEKLRSVLARLFPDITFEGKTGQYTSHFRISFSLGEALALVSGTEAIVSEPIVRLYQLKFKPDFKSKGNLPRWSVTVMSDVGGEKTRPDPTSDDEKTELEPTNRQVSGINNLTNEGLV